MTTPETRTDAIARLAVLAEPTRRRLYDLVAASREPVGRDEAVAVLRISRELAAFHLDRLVEAGLLATEYRRLSGRSGPGAGRPAKLYRRAAQDVEVSLPARHYELAADLLATALARVDGGLGIAALASVARERGTAVGIAARGIDRADAPADTTREGAPADSLADVVNVLRNAGYEPWVEADGHVYLGNCPYRALVAEHRELTCGMNLTWAEGVVDGLGVQDIAVQLAPAPGRCCVVFGPGPGTTGELAD